MPKPLNSICGRPGCRYTVPHEHIQFPPQGPLLADVALRDDPYSPAAIEAKLSALQKPAPTEEGGEAPSWVQDFREWWGKEGARKEDIRKLGSDIYLVEKQGETILQALQRIETALVPPPPPPTFWYFAAASLTGGVLLLSVLLVTIVAVVTFLKLFGG